MIAVTDLHDNKRYINADLIETVEGNPDTQITLTNGHRYYVKEKPEAIAALVMVYRRQCEARMPAAHETPEKGVASWT